jgi:hypothetical protein
MEIVNMRRVFLSAVAACVLVVASFSLGRARGAPEGAASAAPVWEYRVFTITEVPNIGNMLSEPAKTGKAVEVKLNEFGRDGWELCEYLNGFVVFKRQKP